MGYRTKASPADCIDSPARVVTAAAMAEFSPVLYSVESVHVAA